VLLIDRHPLVVAALSRLLSGGPLNAQVIATTRSSDALELLAATPVHVVVCDVTAQPISGPALTAMLASRYPSVKVILLADREGEPLLLAALQSGAAGFFTKEGPVDEFVAGVGTVLQGQFVVGSALLGRVLSRLAGKSPQDPDLLNQLSPAEHSILGMIAEARSIRSIAEARGLSPKTVRNHLARVYDKLHVRNRAEAMLWAVRMGLTGTGRDQPSSQ
jgi:DNA-binding NarL/FixJ family response regulator